MTNRHPRKQLRKYRFRAGYLRPWRIAAFTICALVLVVCVYELCSYIGDYARSKQLSAELREIYYASTEEPSPPTETPLTVVASAETPTPQPAETALPTLDPLATPAPQPYPLNPYKIISERFNKLRRQNTDIVGWISINELLSEAVVQRDNSYYLRRDYRGYHNTNGAIFLDEACSLATRPHTLILYGHNMKTGAMFGSLRNYENVAYYRNNPFITFDTLYEEGRYVIFSVAEVSLNAQARNYSGFYRLQSCTNMERAAIIQDLCSLSVHTCPINVNADDQLLLLVTCVGDDTDRRVVAARRVRDGENESDLLRQVQSTRNR